MGVTAVICAQSLQLSLRSSNKQEVEVELEVEVVAVVFTVTLTGSLTVAFLSEIERPNRWHLAAFLPQSTLGATLPLWAPTL